MEKIINNTEVVFNQLLNPIFELNKELENPYLFRMQVIKRRKDPGNGDMLKGERTVVTYYVATHEQFYDYVEIAKGISIYTNSRIYIDINPKGTKGMTSKINAQINQLQNSNSNWVAYLSILEKSFNEFKNPPKEHRYWILDLDDFSNKRTNQLRVDLEKKFNINPVKLETLNGYHLVINRVNKMELIPLIQKYGLTEKDLKGTSDDSSNKKKSVSASTLLYSNIEK